MRYPFLLPLLILFGCAQVEDGELSATYLIDNELSQPESSEVIEEPSSGTPLLPVELGVDPAPVSLIVSDPCFCEWRAWEDRGLLCMGVVCSEACSSEFRECREIRRICTLKP
jgi:hypothetical protein